MRHGKAPPPGLYEPREKIMEQQEAFLLRWMSGIGLALWRWMWRITETNKVKETRCKCDIRSSRKFSHIKSGNVLSSLTEIIMVKECKTIIFLKLMIYLLSIYHVLHITPSIWFVAFFDLNLNLIRYLSKDGIMIFFIQCILRTKKTIDIFVMT